MTSVDGLVERNILSVTLSRCAESPVVLLEGPRTVGKSTLLRALAAQLGGEVLDLDDIAVRDAVAADPATMIGGPGPVLLDEYQHAPIVLDAIKARLNRSSEPGQFVLTGSARHESLPRAAQALTGRLQRLPVLPLTQAEQHGCGRGLLARLLREPAEVVAGPPSSTTRDDYVERILRGGLPLALAAPTPAARGRWIDSYLRLSLERDVQELSRIRQAHALPAVLERLAGQTAQVLNGTAVAADLGVDAKTGRDYVRLLESVFLVRLLPAWDRTLTKRTTAKPKVHLVDSAIAARLLRITAAQLTRRDPVALTEFGHLLESFVIGELLGHVAWTDGIVGVGHWRTKDRHEVDLVIESEGGRVLAFEIKASTRAAGEDFRGLRALRERLGHEFLAGFVLYTGGRSFSIDDRLHALPIDTLWSR
ncbi:MAG: ATP-binding protein [Micropruina sp.]|uniref:ATP-binding protein n=1 Tax=Micropruina sp. TaxID=2737536 RepID=UPI0039E5A671